MTNKMLAPFSNATREVFKLMLDLDVVTETPEVIDTIVGPNDKLNISIKVVGDLSGEIFYRFPKETTLEMVKIMSGMEFDQIDDFVTSAMGEIANIISGNALIGLSEQEVTCDILPPQIIVGENGADTQEGNILSTTVRTQIGDVDLDIILHSSVDK
ncbi:MAG: hypothetical protein K0R90_1532 [Oscillospiraceae bacterium]|jgi:chemotaxis protein CheX|nr:hypothetical protein [Oscillospiraceae bacterium]